MIIEIDCDSGFCFGVTTAIRKAEEQLAAGGHLYCLGDIVHNGQECQRLQALGLQTVDHDWLSTTHNTTVLLRAHGEPPSTYATAQRNNIRLIDATCPVVLHLQRRIKTEYDSDTNHERQIVIYGKNGHAEVIGLVGQTDGTAIVIENVDDAQRLIDFSRPLSLYSQTTKSIDGFHEIVAFISQQTAPYATSPDHFRHYDTICRQVANRTSRLRAFARRHDLVLFVSGRKSSNGRILFGQCREVNQRSHIIEQPEAICPEWLTDVTSIGICGATSTPKWLMEQCREHIDRMLQS